MTDRKFGKIRDFFRKITIAALVLIIGIACITIYMHINLPDSYYRSSLPVEAKEADVDEVVPTVRPEDLAMYPEKERINVIAFCQMMVERSLKSPKSADFPWSPTSVTFDQRGRKAYVVSYVDAQNAFGAVMRQNYACVLKFQGGGAEGWSLAELSWF